MRLDNFVNRHLGRRVFIFGSGPSFLKISKDQIKKIEENEISIAVSLSLAGIKPTYWTSSGHPVNAAYALNYADPKTILLFSQGPDENIFFKNESRLINIYDRPQKDNELLPKNIVDNFILGSYNVLLNAVHLAYILGAREMIFVGFDYENRLHYYSQCDELGGDFSHITRKEEIIKRLKILAEKYKNDTTRNFSGCDTISEGCLRAINLHEDKDDVDSACQFHSNEIMKKLPLSPHPGTREKNLLRFKRCIDQFKKEGIKLYTIADSGITIESGIENIDINNLIKLK